MEYSGSYRRMVGGDVHAFLVRLNQGVLLADGAMGTQLYARGVPFDQCFDELNLTAPELVRGIHLDYLASGAELIETNTFGANRFKLAGHGLADRLEEINRAGAALARDAAAAVGRRVFVAGSMGPIGRPMAPLGTVSPEEVREAYGEQARALVAGGADVLILETFTDLAELLEALRGAREAAGVPIIAQMTFTQDGRTLLGHGPREIVQALERAGAEVVGANCSVGPQGVLEVMEQMAAAVRSAHLSAMPNAGFPSYVGGRYIYVSTPEYMAAHAVRLVALGVRIVGGCCGTTPEHIARMRDALQHPQVSSEAKTGSRWALGAPVVEPEPVAAPPGTPSALGQKLGRTFVVTVEVHPPRGVHDHREIEACRRLREAGADAVDIADNPMARLRMSPWAMSSRIQSEVGLETILHFTTRDRNLVRLQSDLLAVHALGIRNVLVLRGDPPQIGDYPNATAVSDVTPSGLVKLIKEFNRGRDVAGNAIGTPTAFSVGVALNLSAADLDREARILDRKVRAGADFICTMPVYEPEALDRFERIGGRIPLPVLVGVLPLVSSRHAEFLHNEVPGLVVPEAVRARLRAAADGREEGL
ncbi:MAG: bifunctional homocysteine S-methyltransferase/methylenetetrahydrofolate reductase, partial [Armatimonadota bacterium]|nr:bifunctional homocysteine S-methyltransferase/methylenetetrahydrofolate reductase [Armatimonadota bacterium]